MKQIGDKTNSVLTMQSTRRGFFQSTLVVLGVATLFQNKLHAEGRGGGKKADASATPTLVDPNSTEAKAVSYKHKNTEITDKNLMADRQGVKFGEQKCHSCALYQKDTETTVSGKKAGKCLAPFATGKYVSGEGWCTTWAKKS